MVLVLVRGDHRLNEIKLPISSERRSARPAGEEIEDELGPSASRPGRDELPVLKDAAIGGDPTSAAPTARHAPAGGPARAGLRVRGVDVRAVEAGDTAPGGGTIEIEPAIEVGNIFKLGTATRSRSGQLPRRGRQGAADRDGQLRDRAGPDHRRGDRAGADERGIVWPRSIAPWEIHWSRSPRQGSAEREAADRIYEELLRNRRRGPLRRPRGGPGEKLTDSELLGCPLRVVVGRRGSRRARSRRRSAARRRARAAASRTPPPRRWRCSRGSTDGEGRRAPPAAADGPTPASASTAAGRPAPDPQRPAAAPAGRSRTSSATCASAAIPVFLVLAFSSGDGGLRLGGDASTGDRHRRLRRRLPRPRHRPVQPDGRPA